MEIIAALLVASAALLTSLVQAWALWGPRRNGSKAVLRHFEDELRETRLALDDCLEHSSDVSDHS